MSKDSSQEDAGRIQAIRDAARAPGIPGTMVQHLIVGGYSVEAATAAITEYTNTGYWVSACGSCAWGTPPRASESLFGDADVKPAKTAYSEGL